MDALTALASNCAAALVVELLPAFRDQDDARRTASRNKAISDVTSTPAPRAAASSGFDGATAGLATTTSASVKSSARCSRAPG